MKHYLLPLITALLIASCGKDTIELPAPSIDFIQTAEVTFDGIAGGEQKTITFRSPKAWIAEVHQNGAWLKADPLNGTAGDANIALTTRNDNFGITSRQANVEIHIDGYQPYIINVEQKTASTSQITIDGHIDDGVMTLASDDKGITFSDTIYVTSKNAWTLSVDSSAEGILSFSTDGIPQNGTEQRIRVIVSADYSKFTTPTYEGRFYVNATDGTAVPVTVRALPSVAVYDNSTPRLDKAERTSFELVDTISHGNYQTTFYIDSNVRWSINSLPSWLTATVDVPTNILSSGNIDKTRHPVTLRVAPSALSTEGKTGTINILDSRGNVLKTLNIIFAGTGASYISHTLAFPASDAIGNPWLFEAKKSTVEESGAINRRRISMDFNITTAGDYTSIADAPYHLLLADGTNSICRNRQVHWASLHMGDTSQQSTTASGMHTKQIVIEASERGDADDTNGITDASLQRNAFVFIVPKSVSFADLFSADGKLRDAYADNFVFMGQKNDPGANYRFAFVGIPDGTTLPDIKPSGESRSYDVVPGSFGKCDYSIDILNADGTWSPSSDCTLTYSWDDNDNPLSMTLTFKENKAVVNPFTHVVSGSDRRFRIQFSAFLGDEYGMKVIYTIYAFQPLNK